MRREDLVALGAVATGTAIALALSLPAIATAPTGSAATYRASTPFEFEFRLDVEWESHPARAPERMVGPEDASTGWHRPDGYHPTRH